MTITAHSAIIGCVLPAAALALVATLYIFTRRKKDEPDRHDKDAPQSRAVRKPTSDDDVIKPAKKDVVLDSEKDTVRKRVVSNGTVDKQNDKHIVPTKTTENVVVNEKQVEKEVEEVMLKKDEANQNQSENVTIEELFRSAKASMELAPREDLTDGKDADQEAIIDFVTSLMAKPSEEDGAWSAEEVVMAEEVSTDQSQARSLDGAGDAPRPNSNNNHRKPKDNKKKPEKKKEKKPVNNKQDPKKVEAKTKPKEAETVNRNEQQNNHQRSHSESASEVSSDSGNGNSLTERQSLPSPSNNTITCYQFEFPSRLCGKFVGKSGRNINQIKNASGCQITLLQHPFYNPEYQICTLDGTEDEVSSALTLIKEKFPTSLFSDVTYEPFQVVSPEMAHPVISPDLMEFSHVYPMDLRLIDGIFNDVVVSSVVDASQIFVQQPAHPTFPSLESLHLNMNACYNQDPSAPTLPTPVEVGVICAAPMLGAWYRAQILAWRDGDQDVDVKFVDYGGYGRVKLDDLKQIRSDFMTIPFQACECYMAHVAPLEGEEAISLEASALLEEMTQGCVLQCEIVQYDEMTKVPYVYLYKINGSKTQFVNRELVDAGVVRWME